MDSITQAVLGAAVGEAVLGKQLKNRAILWGAVAGTIPDLDVVSRLFIDEPLYGLIYHRGLSHSILFTFVAPLLFALLSHNYYKKGLHLLPVFKYLWFSLWILFYAGATFGLGYLAFKFPNAVSVSIAALWAVGGYFFYNSLKKSQIKAVHLNYTDEPEADNRTTYWRWYVMYFFAILTHWFIDACTSYGTQIFEPFSSYRISFNNISIVDPLYTIPFLLFLPLVFWANSIGWRRVWNWLGLGLSSAYMIFTFVAKNEVNKVVEQNLKTQGINYTEYTTSPLIFNTILWQAMVQTDSNFYYGMYSLLDKEPKMTFVQLPKNHELITPYQDNELVKIILWFAQGYYNVEQDTDGSLKVHNLRFGLALTSVEENKYSYVMFYRVKNENGKITVTENRQNPSELKLDELLAAFWTRLKGI